MGRRSYSVNKFISSSPRKDSLHRSFLCAVLVVFVICLILLLVSTNWIGGKNKSEAYSRRKFEALLREKQQTQKQLENTSFVLVERILQRIISEKHVTTTEKLLNRVTQQSTLKEIPEYDVNSTETRTKAFTAINKEYISITQSTILEKNGKYKILPTISPIDQTSTEASLSTIDFKTVLADTTENTTPSSKVTDSTVSFINDTPTRSTLVVSSYTVASGNTESPTSRPFSTTYEEISIANLDKNFSTTEVYNSSDATPSRSTLFDSTQTVTDVKITSGDTESLTSTLSTKSEEVIKNEVLTKLDKDFSTTETHNSFDFSEQTTETILPRTSIQKTTVEEVTETNIPLFSTTEDTNLVTLSTLRDSDENSKSTTSKLEETTAVVVTASAVATVSTESNNDNGLIESDYAKFTPEDTNTTRVVSTTDPTETDQLVSTTTTVSINESVTVTEVLANSQEVTTENFAITSATLVTILDVVTPSSASLSASKDTTVMGNTTTTESGYQLSITTSEISSVSDEVTATHTSSTVLVTFINGVPLSSESVDNDRLPTREDATTTEIISARSSASEEIEITTPSETVGSDSSEDDDYFGIGEVDFDI